ncbi:hypothetical protein HXX76_003456 [Chlamydomonas incerta]|uniref:Peptidase S1 domain-containing protein n=1 Tax=Chlamydomonas incerta TaxID=51695 RepID=A0A835TAZ7_CHLIN|nr:hypothetical protein HXX76_003456 [Chlamydomonas incerta]|eukprot:KAG2441848.1 hypothetical protein HXX76_003456 [Chlamydomonas incerta]
MASPQPGPSLVCTLFLTILIASTAVSAVASAAAGAHARQARALLVDGTLTASPAAAPQQAALPACSSCPLTRQPVCTKSGLQLQNACLARCQGIAASEVLCRGLSSSAAPAPGAATQRRRQHSEGDAAVADNAAARAMEVDSSVDMVSMRRFRAEGFVMVAARPPAEFTAAGQAAGTVRRSMQGGSAFNPLPTPLLQVSPPGLANRDIPANAATPDVITEYRITPDGQAFARKFTDDDMASYRSQRGRNSAAGSDANRGAASEGSTPAAAPAAAPAKRRELEVVATAAAQHAVPRHEDGEVEELEEESEHSPDMNDVYVEDESYGDGEEAAAEVEDAAVDVRAAALQERRRRLSYVIPSRDDRAEETTDVYPGRASGRFTYRNPSNNLYYWCSGTLISNNAVLLAAHCVVDVKRSPILWMDTFSFAPGARSGINPYGTATVKFVQYSSLYTNSTPGNDLAVAILNTQPGDLTGWLSYGYDCIAQVLQVNTSGFPSDKVTGTRWRANCTTDNVNPCNLNATTGLVNRCDIVGGQSGAAIFSSSSSTGPRARFVVAYEATNSTAQWNGAAVINQNTFPFIDNLVKTYKVNSPPPPPPRPPPPPSSKKGRRLLRQSRLRRRSTKRR